MFKRTAIVSKDSLALAFVESALPFSLILKFAKIHLFLNLSNSLFILFVCKITPLTCNLFARWFFYLFFSVFYSLYSVFIKLVNPFFQLPLQEVFFGQIERILRSIDIGILGERQLYKSVTFFFAKKYTKWWVSQNLP